jgi:GH24 family phage-related lysozyme (muramidase)
MRKLLIFFVALLTLAAATPAHAAKRNIMELPLFERAVLIIKKFETMHNPKHWPYVGYGHCVQPGEPYRRGVQLTEAQADALLRKDLRKFCALYSQYGKDSLLLS